MYRVAAIVVGLLSACLADAQDATQTDGDKYKVILENECVRVLDYQDLPGDQTSQHSHPPFVLYALGPFERTITLPDGKVLNRKFASGDVMWSEAQTHIGKNVGETPTHVVLIELKGIGIGNDTCNPK
jgi:hypothetical protein